MGGVNSPPFREANMKLTNGKKTIERSQIDYEKNKKIWELRGWKPVEDKPKVDKVEKPKKKKDK